MNFPTLSLKERDRRWAMLRAYMKRTEQDCMLVFGLKGREHYEGYVCNENIEGLVILPRESEPMLISWHPKLIMRRLGSKNDQSRFWVKDSRSGLYSTLVAEVLRERGLDASRIGVVGLESGEPGSPEGLISYQAWTRILAACPKARFQDITWDYREMMLEKSPEEVEIIRHCGRIGERAAQALIDTCKPGATELEIYCAVQHEIHAAAAVSHDPYLIMSWGRDDLGWSEPAWTYSGGAPRRVEPGDLICAELFPVYAGLETQQQVAVAIAPVEPEIEALGRVVEQSYAAGVAALSAGSMFSDVERAMLAPVLAENCWTFTPLLHSVTPLGWIGGMAKNLDEVPPSVVPFRHEMDIKMGERPLRLKEGMSFAFEPNACRGQRRVNIGGSVLVGAKGAVELNTVVNRLHIVDA
jgi:Xaa-Pro aminopeptidase